MKSIRIISWNGRGHIPDGTRRFGIRMRKKNQLMAFLRAFPGCGQTLIGTEYTELPSFLLTRHLNWNPLVSVASI